MGTPEEEEAAGARSAGSKIGCKEPGKPGAGEATTGERGASSANACGPGSAMGPTLALRLSSIVDGSTPSGPGRARMGRVGGLLGDGDEGSEPKSEASSASMGSDIRFMVVRLWSCV
jgi:hypothetical protein